MQHNIMTTILEIQKPELTYCQKYDVHCPCPKCGEPKHWSCKKLWMDVKLKQFYPEPLFCDNCKGPTYETPEDELLRQIFKEQKSSTCPNEVAPKEYEKITDANDN